MNSEKANNFNGLNTQTLSTVFNSLKNQPEMANATFSKIRVEWWF
jgi:hypothetical protein